MHVYLQRLLGLAVAATLTACGGGQVSSYSEQEENSSPIIDVEQLDDFLDNYSDTADTNYSPPATNSEAIASLPLVTARSNNQFADANVIVRLEGSAAVSPSAVNAGSASRIVATQWRQLAGPSVELLSGEALNNLFVSPDVAQNRQLIFVLAAQDDGGSINTASVSVMVRPSDALLRVTGGVVDEADQLAQFTVKLLAARDTPLSVRYTTQSETAQAGSDFEASTGELLFAPGETEKTIAVALFHDADEEDFETFSLQVSAFDGTETLTNIGSVVIRNSAAKEPEPGPVPTPQPTATPSIEPAPTATPTEEPEPEPTVEPPPRENLFPPEWNAETFTIRSHPVNIRNGYSLSERQAPILAINSLDIDGDRDIDIIQLREGSLDLLRNTETTSESSNGRENGNNSIAGFVKETLDQMEFADRALHIADMDNDGKLDLVITAAFEPIIWYQNLGNEGFAKQSLLVESGYQTASFGDLDNDGDSDILLLANNSLRWLESDNGNFSDQPLLSPDLTLTDNQFVIADFDQDGKTDILSYGATGLLLISHFDTSEYSLSQLSTTGCNQMQFLRAETLNLICFSQTYGFTHILDRGEGTIEENTLTPEHSGEVETFKLVDWNGDQSLDLIIAAKKAEGSRGDEHEYLQVFTNSGNSTFAYFTTVNQAHPAFDFIIDDFNGDGRFDLLSAWNRNILSLSYQEDEGDFDTQVLQMEIEMVGKRVHVDMNNDGNLDLLTLAQNHYVDDTSEDIYTLHSLLWLENSKENPGKIHLIGFIDNLNDMADDYFGHLAYDGTVYPPDSDAYGIRLSGKVSTPVDIDGDGDYDLVSAAPQATYLYENVGGLKLQLLGARDDLAAATALVAVDLDGDGQQEVAVSRAPDQLSILEITTVAPEELDQFNEKTSIQPLFTFAGPAQVVNIDHFNVSPEFTASYRLLAEDLNSDGYPDIVSDNGSWLRNRNGESFAEQSIGIDLVNHFELADINFDGHIDLVSTSIDVPGNSGNGYYDSHLLIFTNDGSGNFSQANTHDLYFPGSYFSLREFNFGSAIEATYFGYEFLDHIGISRSGVSDPLKGTHSRFVYENEVDRMHSYYHPMETIDLNADGNEDMLLNKFGELLWVEILEGTDISIDELSTDVGYFTADDRDYDPLRYTISGGADGEHFVIDAESGLLSAAQPLSYREPRDANGDNTYEVILQVSDGKYITSRTVNISLHENVLSDD